ncbi:auxin efflux carrier [Lipomyces kononenkoae]|uniref:Auxin efflux carrier n=1 Tax=Lipomyces kononenkoae TaxID=34357 RepID=A0ACC3T7B8_LIPKO
MALSVGAAIFIAVKPIVKIFFSICFGIYFAKKGVLDPHTCKKMSSVIINYFLPCIVFSKVTVAFDANTMKIAGLTVLTAIVYIACGCLFAALIELLLPVPKYWKGGARAAAIFNNSGDIPMAYVMTITASAPFSNGDEAKGIAYVSIFMAIYVISFFTCGGVQFIERDFQVPEDDPEMTGDEKANIDENLRLRKTSRLRKLLLRRSKKAKSVSSVEISKNNSDKSDSSPVSAGSPVPVQSTTSPSAMTVTEGNVIANLSTAPETGTESALHPVESAGLRTLGLESTVEPAGLRPVESAGMRSIRQRRQSVSQNAPTVALDEDDDGDELDPVVSAVTLDLEARHFQNWLVARLILFLRNLYQPPAASLIVSIVVAVISPVKALFIATGYPMPNAPDGLPPLDFVMDFVNFIGQATVPIGLMLLGALIGRLKLGKLPKGFWKVMVVTTLLKLVVLPIIALAWTQRLRQSGLIPDNNLILVFVYAVSSAVPSATSQVYLTTFFAPEDAERIGQMDCLAAMLIGQYITLVFTLAIIVTYTLKVIIDA